MIKPYIRLALLVSALLFASCEQDESKVPMPPKATESTPEERYNNGAGAPAEPEAAIAWYTEYAEAGVTDAYYKLGLCYYSTRSIPMNFVKAVEHFRLAAEQGHSEARAKLAECYEWGVGVEADPVEAAKWRSETTDVDQHRNIQNTPTKPAEEQPKEVVSATPPIQEKDVDGIPLSNDDEMTAKDIVNGDVKEFLEDNANEKDETAGLNAEQIRELGADYAEARNGKDKDEQKAIQLYIQAAEMGDTTALRWLGLRYRDGRGVSKDEQKARHYFSLAAAQGDTQSAAWKETIGMNAELIRKLGADYADGSNGKEKNDQKAVQLYIQAADKGDSTAQRWLGYRYRDGRGVPKDEERARYYFSLAAAQGDKQAEAALNPPPVQPKKAAPSKAAPKKAKQSTPSKKATKSAPKKPVRNKDAASDRASTLPNHRDNLIERMKVLEDLKKQKKVSKSPKVEKNERKPFSGFNW